jgi:hypothetical protein
MRSTLAAWRKVMGQGRHGAIAGAAEILPSMIFMEAAMNKLSVRET